MIPVNIVVEDALSEAVLRKILSESQTSFSVAYCYGKCGYGYIKRTAHAFNNAAKGMPYLILSDLEEQCAPVQIRDWLPSHIHSNLLFRIAVKEVESWLLADRDGFASFLGIAGKLVPRNVDEEPDPKQLLIALAKRSRKRELREAIVPRPRSIASIGPDYNGCLSSFVYEAWNLNEAANNSPSLCKCIKSIDRFNPTFTEA